MKIVFGTPLVIGVREIMPITGLNGKLKLRMRPGKAAKVTQKTGNGVCRYMLIDKGDHWEPYGLPEVNHTITTP